MRLCLVPLLAALAAPVPATAQETPARRAELSGRLFELALQERDPLLAIAATRVRGDLFGERIDRTPAGDAPMAMAAPRAERGAADSAAPPAASEPVAPAGPVSAEDMLDTALALAPGDPLIEGLVEDQRAQRSKGVVSGQVYSIAEIGAGAEDTYTPLEYEGDSYAEVYVEGQGGTDLNVMVYDSAGRLVCTDTDVSAIAYCGWRPVSKEAFSVVILNRGATRSAYTLITN